MGKLVVSTSKRSSASLRIFSTHLSVEDISQALGLQPNKFFRMGTQLFPQHPKSYVHPFNLWILKSDLDPAERLEAHITNLIDMIEVKASIIESLLNEVRIDLFCGFSSMSGQGGFTLSPELLKRLTILPIKIVVDLYPPDSSPSEEELDSQTVA